MYKIGILVFENVEELDFVGPYETLAYVNKMEPNSVDVKIIAKENNPINAYNGLRFLPNKRINNDDTYDILIVPGGQGRKEAMFDDQIISFINSQMNNLKYLCSVCTGSFIICESIKCDSINATSHYTALEEMTERYPNLNVIKEKVVKNQGNPNIWFGAGISSGINLSLELLKELFGESVSEKVKKRLEFDITD